MKFKKGDVVYDVNQETFFAFIMNNGDGLYVYLAKNGCPKCILDIFYNEDHRLLCTLNGKKPWLFKKMKKQLKENIEKVYEFVGKLIEADDGTHRGFHYWAKKYMCE